MNVKRKQLWPAAFWMALLVAAGHSCWVMRASADRLRVARAKEQECREMVHDIHQLRNRPGFAALGVDSPRTITTRAEEAGKRSGLPASALVRIEPQSALRLGDSPYRLRPTRLELRRVTLEQVITFTHAMTDETQGTTVRDLRLTVSDAQARANGQSDLWTAELVLTQLIFAPLGR